MRPVNSLSYMLLIFFFTNSVILAQKATKLINKGKINEARSYCNKLKGAKKNACFMEMADAFEKIEYYDMAVEAYIKANAILNAAKVHEKRNMTFYGVALLKEHNLMDDALEMALRNNFISDAWLIYMDRQEYDKAVELSIQHPDYLKHTFIGAQKVENKALCLEYANKCFEKGLFSEASFFYKKHGNTYKEAECYHNLNMYYKALQTYHDAGRTDMTIFLANSAEKNQHYYAAALLYDKAGKYIKAAENYLNGSAYDLAHLAFKNANLSGTSSFIADTAYNRGHFATAGRYYALSNNIEKAKDSWNKQGNMILEGHYYDIDLVPTADYSYFLGIIDSVVMVFNSNREYLRKLEGHSGRITTYALAGDGKTIVTASDDGSVRIWDLSLGQAMNIFSVENIPSSCDITFDGKYVVYGQHSSQPYGIQLIHCETGEVLKFIEGGIDPFDLQFSSNGNMLLVGLSCTGGGHIIYSIPDMNVVFESQRDYTASTLESTGILGFSPDDKYYGIAQYRKYYLYETRSNKRLYDFEKKYIEFSKSSDYLIFPPYTNGKTYTPKLAVFSNPSGGFSNTATLPSLDILLGKETLIYNEANLWGSKALHFYDLKHNRFLTHAEIAQEYFKKSGNEEMILECELTNEALYLIYFLYDNVPVEETKLVEFITQEMNIHDYENMNRLLFKAQEIVLNYSSQYGYFPVAIKNISDYIEHFQKEIMKKE